MTTAGPSMSELLIMGVMSGHLRSVVMLLEAGADVNDKISPLICVSLYGMMPRDPMIYKSIVERLLEAGAHVNNTYEGDNAMMTYLYQNGRPDDTYVKLYYAAGELVDWPVLEQWVQDPRMCTVMPEWLQDFRDQRLCLKDLCRVSIRNHLLHLDLHSNLFVRVPSPGTCCIT